MKFFGELIKRKEISVILEKVFNTYFIRFTFIMLATISVQDYLYG